MDLAADLVAVKKVDLGPPHPLLGETTLEPTVVAGRIGPEQRPGEATCILDLRTNPEPSHDELVARLQETGAADPRRERPPAALRDRRRTRRSSRRRGARAPRRRSSARAASPTSSSSPRPACRRSRSGPAAPSARTRRTSSCSRARSSTARASTSSSRSPTRRRHSRSHGRTTWGGSGIAVNLSTSWCCSFTAGEDHELDDRLVAYDVEGLRGSRADARAPPAT